MKLSKILAFTFFFAVAACTVQKSHAQVSNGKVTTSAPSYTNGNTSPLSLDLFGALRMNCTTGCAGGSFNNNADAVATSATNGQAAAWLYAFNGTTFDRLRDDASKNLLVALGAAIPAGANTIGNVGIVAGSAIIGNVRIDQTTPGTTNGVQVNAALPAGTNSIGSLNANQSVNVNQIAGTATSVGAGAIDNGTQRTVLASGQVTQGNWGGGAIGSAVPPIAIYQGVNVGGNSTGVIGCGSSIVYDASTNGSTQLVALSAGKVIYVCGYTFLAAGTVNVELDYGTGTACATGNNKITPAFQLTAQAGIADGAAYWRGLGTTASQELCLKTSAGVAVQAIVYYTQF